MKTIMPHIQAYKRNDGMLISCYIRNNCDIGQKLAAKLYEAYCAQCRQTNKTPLPFAEEKSGYQFDNKLVFGFNDDGVGRVALEFALPDEYARNPKRADMMQQVVELLRNAGVEDDGALQQLGRFISDDTQRSLNTRQGLKR